MVNTGYRDYHTWLRSLGGFASNAESLLSVYLLAMWALTYFGRPFSSS